MIRAGIWKLLSRFINHIDISAPVLIRVNVHVQEHVKPFEGQDDTSVRSKDLNKTTIRDSATPPNPTNLVTVFGRRNEIRAIPYSKLSGEKRALLISTQHVHRKAGSGFGRLLDFPFVHRDVVALRDLLIGTYHGIAFESVQMTPRLSFSRVLYG